VIVLFSCYSSLQACQMSLYHEPITYWNVIFIIVSLSRCKDSKMSRLLRKKRDIFTCCYPLNIMFCHCLPLCLLQRYKSLEPHALRFYIFYVKSGVKNKHYHTGPAPRKHYKPAPAPRHHKPAPRYHKPAPRKHYKPAPARRPAPPKAKHHKR
jgi:hypothetical protein